MVLGLLTTFSEDGKTELKIEETKFNLSFHGQFNGN